MRVLTWNVWWRFGGAWRTREPAIVATLRATRPDLVGLVETWAGDGTTQAERLGAVLGGAGMATAFAPTALPPVPDGAGADLGLALLSRWPIRVTETHELPHPGRPGAPPTALLSIVEHPRGPLPVIVTCLEWEPRWAADQLAQSEALAALATDHRLDGDLPVLLLGDLNAAPGDPEVAPLFDVMVDTWTAGGGDPAAVTLSSALPEAPLEATKQIDRRIDHILARPGRTDGSVRVRRACLTGLSGSDHFAVVADLDP
jgi:endonuclease/exonuclease/phosphatase family metal-dependent hydrolase